MTALIDYWRAVDPEARLVSGSVELVRRPVRGILRTRAMAPHLPPAADGELLVMDAALLGNRPLDAFFGTLHAAGLRPSALLLAATPATQRLERCGEEVPVLASARSLPALAEALSAYQADERGHLDRLAAELRLAAAEAALSDPDPTVAAGLVGARLRRGVAVVADGELRSLHPRPAGRALAARFAATQARLLVAQGTRTESTRHTPDGLWLLERRVRPGAAAWLFDDLPFARVDQVALEALCVTLRALLRRGSAPRAGARPAERAMPAASGLAVAQRGADARLDATLLAVARANGRVAPAARALGVHRNTVLYRLRQARAERGVDPRRPEDALRILAEAERQPGGPRPR